MGDLSTYRLSDFILFSRATYFRQFELYNQAIWPLHIVAILFSCMVIYVLWKEPRWATRFVAVLLVISWCWVAWAFLYQRFYQIHVIANWYALGFISQAGLIAWYGVINNQLVENPVNRLRVIIGAGLLFASFILYPFIPLLTGRSWLQFEMFGLAPDPTALATLGILVVCRSPKALYVIPILWVLISGMTLLIM